MWEYLCRYVSLESTFMLDHGQLHIPRGEFQHQKSVKYLWGELPTSKFWCSTLNERQNFKEFYWMLKKHWKFDIKTLTLIRLWKFDFAHWVLLHKCALLKHNAATLSGRTTGEGKSVPLPSPSLLTPSSFTYHNIKK